MIDLDLVCGEAPLMQVWLLDLEPTQAYEPKVCEPSEHY
jgi:hypothetical protein